MAASSFPSSDRPCAGVAATPVVAVLVTTYNHSRFVIECLDSVRAQTFRDFEVVITDDASSDGTAELIQAWLARSGYPARFVRNRTNRGICANRNTALSLTSAPFVCSLSGDDAYEPDRLERQAAFFLDQPAHVAAIYSDMRRVEADGRSAGMFPEPAHAGPPADGTLFARLLREEWHMPAPATMIRRSALEAVGGYDESLAYEDFDMWLRLSHAYSFRYLPGAVTRYRVLPTSLSRGVSYIPAIRESRVRIFESWSGRAGSDEAHLLKVVGWEQIALGRDADGRRSLALAAASGRARDRVAACLVRAPGVCAAVRGVIKLRDRLRPLGIAAVLRRLLTRFRSARARR
jgi:glycosyltransferase involved in cell wall biosynthesis